MANLLKLTDAQSRVVSAFYIYLAETTRKSGIEHVEMLGHGKDAEFMDVYSSDEAVSSLARLQINDRRATHPEWTNKFWKPEVVDVKGDQTVSGERRIIAFLGARHIEHTGDSKDLTRFRVEVVIQIAENGNENTISTSVEPWRDFQHTISALSAVAEAVANRYPRESTDES